MSRPRARTATPVAALVALSTAVLGLVAPAVSAAPATTAAVVINEVYGGGGNNGSAFTHDFVELHNTTASPVDVGSWSVQYASSSGTSWANKTNLTGKVIPAGGRLLVKGAAGSTPGTAPGFAADVDGTLNLSSSNGKVALVSNQTSLPSTCTGATGADPCSLRADVVDFLGYGTANDYAGSGPAAAPTSATAVSRDAAQRNTASNAADFTVGAPTPCGQASCTESATPPAQTPAGGEVSIAQIQGTGSASPLSGQSVTTTGVVTAAYPTGGFAGFVLQTGGTGGPRSTDQPSDGVFVFAGAGSALPSIGASVRVSGTVGEFFGLTQLSSPTVTPLAEALPPVVPSTTDGWPRTDAERESLESVLYRPTGDYTVTNTFTTSSFGEVGLAYGTSPLLQPTEVAAPRSATATAVAADNLARSVPLDDGASTNFLARSGGRLVNGALTPAYLSRTAPVRVGAPVTFTAPVVVDYRNNAFKFQPVSQVVGPQNTGAPATFADTRTAAPQAAQLGDADLSVASFNVLNYFTTLGEKTAGCTPFTDRDGNGVTVSGGCDVRGAWRFEDNQRQQDKIVSAITALDADVVGLMEIENSARLGEPADEAVQTLVTALNDRAGAPVWAANPSSAELGDVSQQDVITNAILYKPAAVERVGAARALSREAAPAFVNARNPIAQVFAPTGGGAPFLFVVNHFKSKGSAGPLPGDADSGDGQGASNASRVAQAEALRDWVPTVQGGARAVVMVGDYNAYTQEDPLQVLYSAGYRNAEQALGSGEFSYSFSGRSGSLDHVLLNAAALGRATGTDIWNINSGESLALEYSRHNSHGTDFHAPDAYRSSDHDPVVVGLRAEDAPVPVQLLATNDFHGRLQAGGPDAGAAVLAGAVKQLRAAQPNTVFAAAGDLIGASTFESFIAQDKPTIDALNEAGLEVSAVGNHELDAGYRDLVDRVSRDASWTYVAANLRLKETGDPAVPATWIKDLDGVQIGFVGAVTEDLPTLVSPTGIAELEVTAILPSVNAATADLKREGADVVVLLVHEGSPTSSCAGVTGDNAFGRIVNGLSDDVDAVVSGHTHLSYTCQVPVPGWADRAVTTRPVVSAGQYGSHLNQLLLSVDPGTGRLLSQSAALLPLAGRYAADPATKKIVDDAVAQAAVLGARVLGQTTAALPRAQRVNEATGARVESRGAESALGNLVAEVQRRQTGTQIAVMNSGGLRADLPGPGDVTFRQAANVQPFANTLVSMTLTGAQLKTLLEQQWQPGNSRPFLRLGLSEGLTYTYDPSATLGQHVREIRLDGRLLDPAGRYSVTANSFLAGGGDNFAVLTQGTDRRDTGKIDLAAFVDELAARGSISPDRTQRSVGVRFPDGAPATYAPGDTVRLDLSSLSFTTAADVLDTEVVATLAGTEVGRFGVRTVIDGSLFDEAGTAAVSFAVPAGTSPGSVPLVLTGATTGTRAVVPLTVARRPSTVTVASDAPTSLLGAPVTLTATVVGGVAGTVQFFVDGTPVGDAVEVVGGRATSAPVRGLAVGTHGVSAVYSGDTSTLGSTSPTVDQLVRYAVTVLSPVAGNGKDPKAGSEVEVRFRLTDVDGTPISDDEAAALGRRVTVAATGAQALAATPAEYDSSKASPSGKPVKDKHLGAFTLDWKTAKGRTGKAVLSLSVAFADGPAQVTEVPVTLR